MLGFDGEYPVVQPKTKFWRFLVKNCKKSAVKHSIENLFCLVSSICLQPFVQDCRLEYTWKFPDPNGHENHHVGEAATIREPLDKRVVEFLKTQTGSGCKKIKEPQKQASIFVSNVIFAHEKKPESYRRKFRPNNKKIKNLVASVKNETR